MPELPEVETIRRELEPAVAGRVLGEAWAFPHPKFTPALQASGGRVIRLVRRGKYLLFGLSGLEPFGAPSEAGRRATSRRGGRDRAGLEPVGAADEPGGHEEERTNAELIVHLGMTGSLGVRRSPDALEDPYVRAWWTLKPGPAAEGPPGLTGPDRSHLDECPVERANEWEELSGYAPGWGAELRASRASGAPSGPEWLVFRDIRRFGRIQFAEDQRYVGTLALQGPDALDPGLTADDLWRALRASSRALKTQLLSQRPVAGVGNIYADEALWMAGINPRSRRLGQARAGDLLEALREVLTASIGNGGTTLRDYRTATGALGRNQGHLACYGRAGEPCLRCGTMLRRIVLDTRSTTYCPTCQT